MAAASYTDERLERRWRRRLNNNSACNSKLKALRDHNVVFDPDYKIFLENLKENGRAYMFEYAAAGIVVHYEQPEFPQEQGKKNGAECVVHGCEVAGGSLDDQQPEHEELEGINMMDENYLKFLDWLEPQGNTVECVSNECKRVFYGGESEKEDEPQCYIVEQETLQDPIIDLESEEFEPTSNKSSEFKEKLMEVLQKPFDQKEFEQMMQEVSERKKVHHHREMRTMKFCSTDRLGKSYLQYYPDLQRKIEGVSHDHPRVLNILRGFFYWLKNSCNEDSFRPWLDKSCLDVIPPKCTNVESP